MNKAITEKHPYLSSRFMCTVFPRKQEGRPGGCVCASEQQTITRASKS